MRYKIFYDGKEKYTLASFDTREMAEVWIKREERSPKCALFPSLSADIGLLSDAPLWGREITPEALRAVSYYFGICAGWPLDVVAVECGEKKLISLPLVSNSEEKIYQRIKICKQMFENTEVFTAFSSHTAIRFFSPFSFVLIESECPDAVDLCTAEGMQTAEKCRLSCPICFAALREKNLLLRACMRGRGEMTADDSMYMRALAYFYLRGRASMEDTYVGGGGFYRVCENQTVEALRTLSPISV